MIINHNLPALDAYNKLSGTNVLLAKSLEKLSSGLRINRAGDDAAGLAISEKMRSQIRGLDQATRNSQDGISLIQTAEGALNETHSILQRMRELAVQAANDTLSLNDRQEIQKEVDQLKLEVNRIANTTEFNTKKLLDGTASALTSSDVQTTSIIVNGQVTNFGNYDMSINVNTIGKAQVQKTDIFKSADLQIVNESDVSAAGINDVALQPAGNRLPEGSYKVYAGTTGATSTTTVTIDGIYMQGTVNAALAGGAIGLGNCSGNATVLMEVTAVGGTTLTFDVTVYGTDNKGVTHYSLTAGVQLTADGTFSSQATLNGLASFSNANIGISQFALLDASTFRVGDKIMFDVTGETTTAADTIRISCTSSQLLNNNKVRTYNFESTLAEGMTNLQLWNVYMNTSTGTVYDGKLTFDTGTFTGAQVLASSFDISASGSLAVANIGTALSEIDRFTDASGNFLLQNPQTIKIYQGDGKSTDVTIFGTDTLEDVRKKLNDAIGDGLGQADLVSAAASRHFVTYVQNAQVTGQEAVGGTFVIRSGVTGAKGELTFSGDQAFINALSLTTIQQSAETQFTIDVKDAHTGNAVALNQRISGNRLVGVVDKNVDVIFDPNADTTVNWNGANKSFTIAADAVNTTTTTVHIANNSLMFQIGANPKQNVNASIGNMSAQSLGIDSILVTDNTNANRAITSLDVAISKVSSQRANMGAIQNRLEHTINNLTVASENLTAAESRIRDVDMAKEMMNYTKLNILSQAGTAMLAQANQLPQSILTLLR